MSNKSSNKKSKKSDYNKYNIIEDMKNFSENLLSVLDTKLPDDNNEITKGKEHVFSALDEVIQDYTKGNKDNENYQFIQSLVEMFENHSPGSMTSDISPISDIFGYYAKEEKDCKK